MSLFDLFFILFIIFSYGLLLGITLVLFLTFLVLFIRLVAFSLSPPRPVVVVLRFED